MDTTLSLLAFVQIGFALLAFVSWMLKSSQDETPAPFFEFVAWLTGFPSKFNMRLIMGFGEAGLWTLMLATILDWFGLRGDLTTTILYVLLHALIMWCHATYRPTLLMIIVTRGQILR